MSLFSRTVRPRAVDVYVSIHPDGTRSVSIYGGTLDEVGALMDKALAHPHISTALVSGPGRRGETAAPVPWYPAFAGPSETY
ncbi:hypothetical protein [Nocardia acidivorans]|uniref:hypothetical protein n=1 Tax=Nocardia acidivorans TaxID=404580 RepID=UPI0008379931|nr:hypothetical protein [Nocardia acidivorans]